MRPTGAKGQYRVSSESLARQLPTKGTGKLITGQQWSGQRFETIFLHQYGRVYRLLVRILGSAAAAEDAAQEVFLRLYRQEHLPADEAGLQRWLAKVAVNHALNLLRTDKRQQQRWQQQALLQQHEIAGREVANDPAQLALLEEEIAQVGAVLEEMPERSRALLILRYRGFAYAEIATALEIAPGSVGTLLARAEHDFRQRYNAARGEERK